MLNSPIINVMTAAVQKAARGLVRDFGEVENLQVSKKGPADFVTSADKRAEKILIEELMKARPSYQFLVEERGVIVGKDQSNKFIIDPLDGTTNFLHGIPQFCISVALERDSALHAAMIYNPVLDEMFMAEKGKGAFLGRRRLRVSGRRALDESLFATGIPFQGRQGHKAFIGQLEEVMANTAGVRRFGSAALDLAWVAAGRYEGFWEQGLNPWDMAAGVLVVQEAGGFVSDFSGGKNMLETGGIIAASDHMHGKLFKLVTQAAKPAA